MRNKLTAEGKFWLAYFALVGALAVYWVAA